MKYIDYNWDLTPDRILLDEELDIDKLGWRHGDHFKLVNINGQAQLIKVDQLEIFLKGHKVNGTN